MPETKEQSGAPPTVSLTARPAQFQTPQEQQVAQLVTELVDKTNAGLKELSDRQVHEFKANADAVAKLSNDFKSVEAKYAERFKAIATRVQAGGPVHGFASREEAAQFGRFVAAVYRRDASALAELQKAGMTPGTGPEGGYLLVETIVDDLMRDLDQAGIFLQHCPPIAVNALGGGSVQGRSGVTVYHPKYGSTIPISTPGIGGTNFDLLRYCAAVEIDNWMLDSALAAALGEYVRSEMTYGLMLATDTEWFMGTGTEAYGRYLGLFKQGAWDAGTRAGVQQVVGDSGDDTFAEIIAKSTYYLAQMLGKLPQWAHALGPTWFMHPLVFFSYLGIRDSAGMPIAGIFLAQNAPALRLMGYPVQLLSIAPSTTAVSTPFVLLAALRRACRTYRHSRAIEFRMTDQLKWLENITTFAADVPMDMKIRNGEAIVQLVTHS